MEFEGSDAGGEQLVSGVLDEWIIAVTDQTRQAGGIKKEPYGALLDENERW